MPIPTSEAGISSRFESSTDNLTHLFVALETLHSPQNLPLYPVSPQRNPGNQYRHHHGPHTRKVQCNQKRPRSVA